MKIIKPYFEIEEINGIKLLKNIEKAGRTCYKSENLITEDSAIKFIKDKIVKLGHESVLEHEKVTVRIVCDRGVTHEIVRHRIAAYSQESTRYCNYAKQKFGNEITVIEPYFFKDNPERYEFWKKAMEQAEAQYFALLAAGATPQEARSVLPNSLKTEIVVTYNLREWRHFFKLRTSPAAHPQMREIAIPMLEEFKKMIPVIFDDIGVVENKAERYLVVETSEREVLGVSFAANLDKAIEIANNALEKWCENIGASLDEDEENEVYGRAKRDSQAAWCNLGHYNWDAHIVPCAE